MGGRQVNLRAFTDICGYFLDIYFDCTRFFPAAARSSWAVFLHDFFHEGFFHEGFFHEGGIIMLALRMPFATGANRRAGERSLSKGRGFSPPRSGLMAWHRADYGALAASGARANAGERCATWLDHSGMGRETTQTTDDARPTALNDHGIASLAFDGGDSLGFANFSLPAAATLLLTFRTSNASATQRVFSQGSIGNNFCLQIFSGVLRKIVAHNGSGALVGAGKAISNDVWHVAVLRVSGSASELWLNGGSAAADAGATLGTSVYPSRFSKRVDADSEYLLGRVGESLLYGGALSLADVNAIGGYLAAKYGVNWTMAT
jgi:hypothetical protein